MQTKALLLNQTSIETGHPRLVNQARVIHLWYQALLRITISIADRTWNNNLSKLLAKKRLVTTQVILHLQKVEAALSISSDSFHLPTLRMWTRRQDATKVHSQCQLRIQGKRLLWNQSLVSKRLKKATNLHLLKGKAAKQWGLQQKHQTVAAVFQWKIAYFRTPRWCKTRNSIHWRPTHQLRTM